MQYPPIGGAPAPLDPVECDSGLTPYQQREREAAARMWAWRILDLMNLASCSASDAVRAVELADREVLG